MKLDRVLPEHKYEIYMSSGKQIYFSGDQDEVNKLLTGKFHDLNTTSINPENGLWRQDVEPTLINSLLIETIKIHRDESI